MTTTNEIKKPETPEQLIRHITELMSEAEALLVGPESAANHDRLADLRSSFEQVRAKLASVCGEARQKLADGAKLTDRTIRTHPYESLAVALGVGVLLGVILRRQHS